MCYCRQGVSGNDYSEQCIVEYKEKRIQCDPCLVGELVSLWRVGIETVESCCGHNRVNGYISVRRKHVERMKDLGYQKCWNAELFYPGRNDSFLAKSVSLIEPNTLSYVVNTGFDFLCREYEGMDDFKWEEKDGKYQCEVGRYILTINPCCDGVRKVVRFNMDDLRDMSYWIIKDTGNMDDVKKKALQVSFLGRKIQDL